MDFSRFSALTFDCYGTLIDWETGLLRALKPLLESHGWTGTDDEALELFGSTESEVQAGVYKPYGEVLRRTVDTIAARIGFTPAAEERDALRASLADWPAFADTPEALALLKRRFRLAAVSNIDDDLFELSARHLGVPMDEVVTAQQVGSYKPAPGHFHMAFERLGVPPSEILHVAQSLFHDIAPANALGLATVWVNRRAGRAGFGATPPAAARPALEVPDLITLARQVERGG